MEGYLISSSLLAIQAQRLVRRVCTDCASTGPISADELAVLQITREQCPKSIRDRAANPAGTPASRSRGALSCCYE